VLTQLETPVEAAECALSMGRAAGAITILNPAPVRPLPESVLQLIDVLTPNEKEARCLVGREPDAPVEPATVAKELVNRGVKQVVLTLGEKGALLVNASTERHFPAILVDAVVDTTGAGDSFNAGLAISLAHGDRIEDAVEFAIVTGAMAVTKEGVIPSLPRRDEVFAFCTSREIKTPQWLGSILPSPGVVHK
jgi:ribokinase